MVRCSLETRDGGRTNRYPEERVDSLGISDRGAPKGKFLSIGELLKFKPLGFSRFQI